MTVKIGHIFQAKDFSCIFTVTEFTKVGFNGKLTKPTGEISEGAVTYSQLENDFSIMNSTHLVDYGSGKSSELAIVIGKYYKPLRKRLFGGDIVLLGWRRLPEMAVLIPCVEPIVEDEGSGLFGTSDNIR